MLETTNDPFLHDSALSKFALELTPASPILLGTVLPPIIFARHIASTTKLPTSHGNRPLNYRLRTEADGIKMTISGFFAFPRVLGVGL